MPRPAAAPCRRRAAARSPASPPPTPRDAATSLAEVEDGSEIIDVGQGEAGRHEIAEGSEKSVRVILGHRLFDGDPRRCRTNDGVWVNNRPGIVFGSVDAVSVAGEGGDTLGPAGIFGQRGGERQQEFAVAPAAPIAVPRDGGLAARQQYCRRRTDLAADA